MGQIVAVQVYLLSLEDGWNQNGVLKPDGLTCEYHCRNYTDPTGYAPLNSPYDRSNFVARSCNRWQPLLEDDGKGFFYFQKKTWHPHIGRTGAIRFLPGSDRITRAAKPPRYSSNRRREMTSVISRMAELDDVKRRCKSKRSTTKILIGNVVLGCVRWQSVDGWIHGQGVGQTGSCLVLRTPRSLRVGLRGDRI